MAVYRLPSGREVTFPEDASPSEIEEVLNQLEPYTDPTVPKSETGKGMGAGWFGLKSGAAKFGEEAAQRLGLPETEEAFRAAHDRYEAEIEKRAAKVGRVEAIESLGDFANWFSHTAGQAVGFAGPAMVATPAIALGAGALGATTAAAGAIGLAGGAAALVPSLTGENLKAQEEAGAEENFGVALGTGVAQAALEQIAGPTGRLFKAMIGKATADAAKPFLKRLPREAGISLMQEAGEEVAQQALQRIQAGQDLSSPEAISEFVNSAAGGAVGGLLFSPMGAVRFGHAPAQPQGMIEGSYSPSALALDAVKLDKGSAEQWKGVLRNAPGIKGEELDTLGVDTWLDDQKGPVTKAQLQDYIRSNQVDIEERKLGEPSQEDVAKLEAAKAPTFEAIRRNDKLGFDGVAEAAQSILEHDDWAARWDVTDPNDIAAINEWRNLKKNTSESKARWSKYSTPGSTNYREILYKLPSKGGPIVGQYEKLQKEYDQALEDMDVDTFPVGVTQVPGGKQQAYNKAKELGTELDRLKPEYEKAKAQDFNETHWPGHKNVFAHTRAEDLTLANGEKALNGLEFQSTWHQQGRKQGYTHPRYVIKNRHGRVISATRFESKEEAQPLATAPEMVAKFGPLTIEEEISGGVPDAPYKNSWHELAFRRLLHEAALKGYDRLTWSTGDHISPIIAAGDQKVLEGNRVFYDKILPAYANKFLKKWGIKAEKVESAPADSGYTVRKESGGYFSVVSSRGNVIDQYHSIHNAQKEADRLNQKVSNIQFHSVKITPELRAALTKEGTPLFMAEAQQQTHEDLAKVRGQIEVHLNQLLGAHADKIQAVDDWNNEAAKELFGGDINPQYAGFVKGTRGFIRAQGLRDIFAAAVHEGWHLLENLGILTPAEVTHLNTRAGRTRMQQLINAARAEGVLNIPPDYEKNNYKEMTAVAAQAYAALRAIGKVPPSNQTTSILSKIANWVRDLVGAVLTTQGYRDVDQLFDSYLRGELAQRQAARTPEARTALGKAKQYVKDVIHTTPASTGLRVNKFSQWMNTMYHLGRRNRAVAPTYFFAGRRSHAINASLEAQSKALEDLGALSKEDKQKVIDIAIVARHQNIRIDERGYGPDDNKVVNGLGYDLPTLEAGQEVNFTPATWKGYEAILKWNDTKVQLVQQKAARTLIQLGHTLVGTEAAAGRGVTPEEIRALSEKHLPGSVDQVALEQLADDLEATLKSFTKEGTYVPLPRIGNWGIVVRKKARDEKGVLKLDANGEPTWIEEPVEMRTFDISLGNKRAGTAEMNRVAAQLIQEHAHDSDFQVYGPFPLTRDPVFRRITQDLAGSLDSITNFMSKEEAELLAPAITRLGAKVKMAKRPPFMRKARFIKGFDPEQGERAIHETAVRFANWLANSEFLPEMHKTVSAAMEADADTGKFLESYVNDITNPQESWAGAKQLGFFWILTDPSAAAMQFFQGVPTMAMLSSFAGARGATAVVQGYRHAIGTFSKDMTLSMDSDISLDLDKLAKFQQKMPYIMQATSSGILKPMQTMEAVGIQSWGNSLVGKARGNLTKVGQYMAKMFGTSEVANRVAAYIASHTIMENDATFQKMWNFYMEKDELFKLEVQAEGLGDLSAADMDLHQKALAKHLIASKVVEETQFTYGKHARNQVMRGALGSTALQFQQYSIAMLEFIWNLAARTGPEGQKAFGLFMLGLMMTSGLWGLPFADNAKNLIQMLYHFATKKRINIDANFRRIGDEVVGNDVTDAFLRGGLRLTGLNIGRRVGMGDVPLMGQILNLLGYGSASDALNAPILSVLGGPLRLEEALREGRPTSAALAEIAPKPLANLLGAAAWSSEGVRSMTNQPVVTPEELDTFDYILKGLGIGSTKVALLQEQRRATLDARDAVKDLRISYYNRLARLDAAVVRARKAGDEGEVQSNLEAVKDLFRDIMEHNRDAAPNEVIRIVPTTRKKNLQEELHGAKALTVPKRSRAAVEEIRRLYQ
jgi:hypothetical protein